MKLGDIVETINGVGTIEDIRENVQGTEYLIRTQGGNFGQGAIDIYFLDEISRVNPK